MRIYIAGHRGLVGSAITRAIEANHEFSWIGATSSELDLRDRDAVFAYVVRNSPDAIVIAAAKVGGIKANDSYPVEFLSDNLLIQTNLLDAAHHANIEKVLFLGSSCIYPKFAQQPIPESELLSGPLESTNEAYAVAKIAGLKLVQAYRKEYGRSWISAMPTNLYGPGDNFHPENSHVLPALIRRFHEAKVSSAPEVVCWGTGEPRREFLHADDLASAAIFLLKNFDGVTPINVGTGADITIKELTALIADVIGFTGRIVWDSTKPNGTPRKLLDVSRMNELGWRAQIGLRDGISSTYRWFLENEAHRG